MLGVIQIIIIGILKAKQQQARRYLYKQKKKRFHPQTTIMSFGNDRFHKIFFSVECKILKLF